jgi:multidrug efflux pump subunit AcrA (membrane-fusion protein)
MTKRTAWAALLGGAVLACGSGPEPVRVTGAALEIQASLEPAEPRVGANQLVVELRDAEGRPVAGAEVAVKVHMHAMGAMPAMGGPARVREIGSGRYAAEFELGMASTWQVELAAEAPGGASARESGAPERADWRVRAARRRLELWDVSPAELDVLARGGAPREELPIRSPATGYVIEKDVVAGGAVAAGQRLLRIAPLERVWIDAEIYESDAALLDASMSAEVELAYLPGRRFPGRVDAVYPALDPATRTLRVRIELDNPGLALRPGMWANVTLVGAEAERTSVPESAVLHAGTRSFVFLDLGGGRFRPREVQLGMRSDDRIEVLAGVSAGDRVVVAGTFLIASESRLRAALGEW